MDMNPCARASADAYVCRPHDPPTAEVYKTHTNEEWLLQRGDERADKRVAQAGVDGADPQSESSAKVFAGTVHQYNALRREQGSLGTAALNGGRGRHTHLGVFGGSSVLLEFELNSMGNPKKKTGWSWKSVFDTLRLPQAEGFYNRRKKKEMCLS